MESGKEKSVKYLKCKGKGKNRNLIITGSANCA